MLWTCINNCRTIVGLGLYDSDDSADDDDDADRHGGHDNSDEYSESDSDIDDKIWRKRESFDKLQRRRLEEQEQEEKDMIQRKKGMYNIPDTYKIWVLRRHQHLHLSFPYSQKTLSS